MRSPANDAFETLMPYVPGKPVSETERELGIEGVIKLASNENPLGPSPKAKHAISQALGGMSDYPDGGAFYLKATLAERLNVKPANLIIGNGTNEIIEMLIRTFVRPDEHMVYAQTSFVIYKLCAQAAGREVREVPLRDMCFDLPAMAKVMDERTKLVFIANPNNPTGTYVNRAQVEAFLQEVPPHVLVVLDEAYFEYAQAEDYPNGLDYLGQRERLVVMRTFSKCYGLAGLRVGYGIANPQLVDYLNRGRQPFNVNSLAQIGALAALDDHEHLEKSCLLNSQQMTFLTPKLRERGLDVVESQANFVLVDFKRDIQELFVPLLREGVIVRPMGGYGLTTSAR
ncbi:MAG: histidinol-phosphate transaminase, partial [Myxococcota bacterium]